MLVVILIFVCTVLYYLWIKHTNKHFNELASKLSGPPTIPVLGNGLSISKYPKGVIHYMIKSSKEYGTVTRHWIGTHMYVFLTDPNDIEIVLRDTQNIRKSSTYDFLRPWLGEGLVTSTGEHWHNHRKALTPAFHFNILEKFVEVFNEKAKVLISKLNDHIGGEPFNIFPYITLYTLDAIMETSMGQKIHAQENTKSDYVTSLNRLQEVINSRVFNPLLRPDIIFRNVKLGKEHDKLLEYINDYCIQVIKQRKEEIKDINIETINDTDDIGKKKRLGFLDLLIVGQRMGNGFTDQDLLEEVNTFLFAGHDTTSAAITFTIFNLAKNQDVQQKIYEEILEIYGPEHQDLTLKDLQKTHYLDMAVKESLRMFPPVSSISRLLETDLKLTKHTIPAGSSVVCFNYMIHRNGEYYKNPEKFDPERFSPENTKGRHPYAFVPFSAGPRNCIGQRYAMLEIKSTIIDLLMNFKILYVEEIQEIQNYIILTPVGGVKVRLEKRK